MNLPRLLLNDEGYAIYRWLRLRWSRRRREKLASATKSPAFRSYPDSLALAEQLRKIGVDLVSPKYKCVVNDLSGSGRLLGSYDFELSLYDPMRDRAVRSTLPWTTRDGASLLDIGKMKWLNAEATLAPPRNVFVEELNRMTRNTNRARISDLGRLVTKPRR